MEELGNFDGDTSNPKRACELEDLTSTGESLGLEVESQLGSKIIVPFDPSLIDVITHTRTIDLLLTRLKENEMILNPEFQRRANIWNDERKSGLIESILLRIPLPSLYISEDKNGDYTVVDGLQRLCAIAHFVNVNDLNKAVGVNLSPLKLKGLQALGEYNGKTYDELPRHLQRRINETELTMHVIRAGTPSEVKFNIFARLNQGGVPLTAQEIRNAIYPGKWREYVRRLAKSPEFLNATEKRIKTERMDDLELVLRFISLYELGLEGKRPSDQNLDDFLNSKVNESKSWNEDKWDEISKAFLKAMRAAPKVFRIFAFRKFYGEDYYRSPINRGIFEAQSVALAHCSDIELTHLAKNSKFVLQKLANHFKTDDSFKNANLYATGSGQASNIRYAVISEIINEVLDAS